MSSESRHKILCGMQAMWGKGAFGCLYSWWRSGPRAVHGAVRRGPEAQHTTNGNFTFPIHAVSHIELCSNTKASAAWRGAVWRGAAYRNGTFARSRRELGISYRYTSCS